MAARETLPCPPSEPAIRFGLTIEPVGAHVHVRVFAGRTAPALVGTLIMAPEEAEALKERLAPGLPDLWAFITPEWMAAAARGAAPLDPETLRVALETDPVLAEMVGAPAVSAEEEEDDAAALARLVTTEVP